MYGQKNWFFKGSDIWHSLPDQQHSCSFNITDNRPRYEVVNVVSLLPHNAIRQLRHELTYLPTELWTETVNGTEGDGTIMISFNKEPENRDNWSELRGTNHSVSRTYIIEGQENLFKPHLHQVLSTNI